MFQLSFVANCLLIDLFIAHTPMGTGPGTVAKYLMAVVIDSVVLNAHNFRWRQTPLEILCNKTVNATTT